LSAGIVVPIRAQPALSDPALMSRDDIPTRLPNGSRPLLTHGDRPAVVWLPWFTSPPGHVGRCSALSGRDPDDDDDDGAAAACGADR